MPSKSFANNNFLLEANASVNFKLTSEKYWFQPYLTAGIGGHKYLGYYGAFMPVSYKHLKLPTRGLVEISGVLQSIKKKKTKK